MDSTQTPTSSRSGPPEDAAPLRVPIAVAAERGVSWLNDLAHLVVFLASPLARHITGQVIDVDGGASRFAH